MKTSVKILVTIIVVILFFVLFGAVVGVMSNAGKTPGILGMIFLAGGIGAIVAIWKKK